MVAAAAPLRAIPLPATTAPARWPDRAVVPVPVARAQQRCVRGSAARRRSIETVESIEIRVAPRVQASTAEPRMLRCVAVGAEDPRSCPTVRSRAERRDPLPDGFTALGDLEDATRCAFAHQDVAVRQAFGA